MRREHKFLMLFGVAVFVPVSVIWYVAWPLIHPWDLPQVDQGEMVKPIKHRLTDDETRQVNTWIQSHKTGWGPQGELPPSQGNIVISMQGADLKKSVILSIWKNRHQPYVLGIQLMEHGPYRMHTYDKEDLKDLKVLGVQ
ncbi:hypothetical protein [Swingsia samuiensis]|uniref:Uncharacterized protein n=1 Tax=Swingsia samuiensis TaxID=1293412 RepID=A0A4Y6UMJ0_9PROT|nr:hypothetical protein [Swingsia samuiensis]QDH17606.1 hypothetical protein E3D00_08555 [Swingsia samuiensis]